MYCNTAACQAVGKTHGFLRMYCTGSIHTKGVIYKCVCAGLFCYNAAHRLWQKTGSDTKANGKMTIYLTK